MAAAEEGVPVSPSWLDECLARMEEACDVYRRDSLLDGLVLTNVKNDQLVAAADCRKHLEALGAEWLEVRPNKELAERLLPGPYLYVNSALKPVYRLYDDKQGAFLTALRPKPQWHDTAPFAQLRAAGTFYDCLSIAVSPRAPENFYHSPQRLRVVVKNLFRITGLKT